MCIFIISRIHKAPGVASRLKIGQEGLVDLAYTAELPCPSFLAIKVYTIGMMRHRIPFSNDRAFSSSLLITIKQCPRHQWLLAYALPCLAVPCVAGTLNVFDKECGISLEKSICVEIPFNSYRSLTVVNSHTDIIHIAQEKIFSRNLHYYRCSVSKSGTEF